jgi:hypothetical protein
MTTGLVGQHQLAPFASPQPGQPLDATVVLGNDNSTVSTYDAHDNDSTIHFQSSALVDRPPASTLGQKWLTTDTGARYIYYDNGSAWVEVDYFRDTGGTIVGDVTVTGNVSISGTLGVTGVATFTAQPVVSSLTASKPVFTDASKGLVSTGTLGTDQGGTNLTTYTTGDILYASATNVLSKLAIGTTGQHLIVTGGVPAWSTDSALGTVTSVSFTGGLISVATATTTPALTVAGTSGGIVYFSSASTWASSGVLAAGGIVVGGGAGATPTSTTTGTGVVTALGVNVGTAGAFVVNGGALGTPSSGAVAASLITAGTFGAGSYTFPGALAITGAFTGATTGTFSGSVYSGTAGVHTSLSSDGLYGLGTDMYLFAPTTKAIYLYSGNLVALTLASNQAATFASSLAISGAFTGATTGAFSGAVTVQPTTGTNQALFAAVNTGGTLYFGLDNSAGNYLGTGGAYGTGIYRPAATTFAISRTSNVDLLISATGAATFSSTLRAGGTTTGASLNYGTCSPALNASATILTSVNYGLITVYETYNTGSGALFFVAAGVVTKISDPDNVYSTTSGTAGKINVTMSSGTVTVQNKHLASDIYQANVLFNG